MKSLLLKITEMERSMLHAYFTTDYGDGPGSDTWSFDVISHSGIAANQARGVLSSLKQKDLICVEGSGQNAATRLTQSGIALCAEMGIK